MADHQTPFHERDLADVLQENWKEVAAFFAERNWPDTKLGNAAATINSHMPMILSGLKRSATLENEFIINYYWDCPVQGRPVRIEMRGLFTEKRWEAFKKKPHPCRTDITITEVSRKQAMVNQDG